MRKVGFLLWLAAVFAAHPAAAQFSAAQPSAELQHLEQRLAATALQSSGDYGMAAMDLVTGEVVNFNGEKAFPMASTMKIAVAAAYLADVDAGRRSLTDLIAGTTAHVLMDRMIVRSDNYATDQLMAALGGPGAVNYWLQSHGLSNIRVDRTIAQLLAAKRDLWDVRDSSTPLAMLQLLKLVDGEKALSPASRGILFDMMRRCSTGTNRIPGMLPAGAKVEHKTGTLNRYTSDVGFLTMPNGHRVAVAFFARGGENRPAVIAMAARQVYDGFASRTSSGRVYLDAPAAQPIGRVYLNAPVAPAASSDTIPVGG